MPKPSVNYQLQSPDSGDDQSILSDSYSEPQIESSEISENDDEDGDVAGDKNEMSASLIVAPIDEIKTVLASELSTDAT
ncbi:MAG: hypothetical protein Q7U12_13675, partial [Undibacterium sp.]|nr:hypothetical protein [Undibacterium sp.]